MLSVGVAASGSGVAWGLVQRGVLMRTVLETSVIAASAVVNNVFGLTGPARDSETLLPPLLQE